LLSLFFFFFFFLGNEIYGIIFSEERGINKIHDLKLNTIEGGITSLWPHIHPGAATKYTPSHASINVQNSNA